MKTKISNNDTIEISKYILEKSEMTLWESEFLCGLINQYQPKKVLEIGVAAGATTALIMSTLDKLELDTEMYSTDLSTQYYRDESLKTGYVLSEVKQYLSNYERHHFLTGKVISEFLDIIGNDIDFLIIDTMHVLPGELLDFLVCLPYLTPDAVVVLHDTALNHAGDTAYEYTRNAFATKVLFDTVSGNKIVQKDENRKAGYPNIAAFKCTAETRANIRDVFSALSITWFYFPHEDELESYLNSLRRHYEPELCQVYEQMTELNRSTLNRYRLSKKGADEYIEDFHRFLNENSIILFYGAGRYGRHFLEYARIQGIEIKAFVISDDENIKESNVDGVPIIYLRDIPYKKEECAIFLTIQEKHHSLIKEKLEYIGFQNILGSDGTLNYRNLYEKIKDYSRMYYLAHNSKN